MKSAEIETITDPIFDEEIPGKTYTNQKCVIQNPISYEVHSLLMVTIMPNVHTQFFFFLFYSSNYLRA